MTQFEGEILDFVHRASSKDAWQQSAHMETVMSKKTGAPGQH